MNNAVNAPAANPTWTCAVVDKTEHAWVLGSAGSEAHHGAQLLTSLHYDAEYMSELRFLFADSLGREASSLYVQSLAPLLDCAAVAASAHIGKPSMLGQLYPSSSTQWRPRNATPPSLWVRRFGGCPVGGGTTAATRQTPSR